MNRNIVSAVSNANIAYFVSGSYILAIIHFSLEYCSYGSTSDQFKAVFELISEQYMLPSFKEYYNISIIYKLIIAYILIRFSRSLMCISVKYFYNCLFLLIKMNLVIKIQYI